MPNNVELEFAAKTDIGRVRSQNEDCVAISPLCGFAVLADGMGGYSAGEVASGIAVDVTRRMLEQVFDGRQNQKDDLHLTIDRPLQQLLEDAIQLANRTILEAARDEPKHAGMGTTIVAVILHHDKITVAHVGDSRVYRLRHGEIIQLTRDHSLLQEQIDSGLISQEWARYAQNKNLVTRAVGVGAEMDVEVYDHQTQQGDLYLLCSDGLSDMIMPEEIASILTSGHLSLEAVCNTLVQRANEHGGQDNISVILIRVKYVRAESAGLLRRILSWVW